MAKGIPTLKRRPRRACGVMVPPTDGSLMLNLAVEMSHMAQDVFLKLVVSPEDERTAALRAPPGWLSQRNFRLYAKDCFRSCSNLFPFGSGTLHRSPCEAEAQSQGMWGWVIRVSGLGKHRVGMHVRRLHGQG
jgi:hypothetical protein